MKAIYLALLVLVCLAKISFCQLSLPSYGVLNYSPSLRDPFISAEAKSTFLGTGGDVRGVVSGDIVRQYLDTIARAIRDYLFVGGVSVGDTPQQSMALINGVSFHYGDLLPLPIEQKQLSTLTELSRAYGLPLQVSDDGAVSILIGRIDGNGVSLLLPGFREALYQLPVQSDTPPSRLKLERPPKPQPH